MPISINEMMMREIIMDHYTHPRNRREGDASYKTIYMDSDSCIDKIYVQAKIENGILVDVCFHGVGCAISIASTSIMTELLKGKTISEAEDIIKNYLAMIHEEPYDADVLDDVALLELSVGGSALRHFHHGDLFHDERAARFFVVRRGAGIYLHRCAQRGAVCAHAVVGSGVIDDVLRNGDGKIDGDGIAEIADARSLVAGVDDAEKAAVRIEEPAARIAVIDGRVHTDLEQLDDTLLVRRLDLDLFVGHRDDAARHRRARAVRIADGVDRLAHGDLIGIGERRLPRVALFQALAAFDADDGDVVIHRAAHIFRLDVLIDIKLPVEIDADVVGNVRDGLIPHRARLVDDVIVGDDERVARLFIDLIDNARTRIGDLFGLRVGQGGSREVLVEHAVDGDDRLHRRPYGIGRIGARIAELLQKLDEGTRIALLLRLAVEAVCLGTAAREDVLPVLPGAPADLARNVCVLFGLFFGLFDRRIVLPRVLAGRAGGKERAPCEREHERSRSQNGKKCRHPLLHIYPPAARCGRKLRILQVICLRIAHFPEKQFNTS